MNNPPESTNSSYAKTVIDWILSGIKNTTNSLKKHEIELAEEEAVFQIRSDSSCDYVSTEYLRRIKFHKDAILKLDLWLQYYEKLYDFIITKILYKLDE